MYNNACHLAFKTKTICVWNSTQKLSVVKITFINNARDITIGMINLLGFRSDTIGVRVNSHFTTPKAW